MLPRPATIPFQPPASRTVTTTPYTRSSENVIPQALHVIASSALLFPQSGHFFAKSAGTQTKVTKASTPTIIAMYQFQDMAPIQFLTPKITALKSFPPRLGTRGTLQREFPSVHYDPRHAAYNFMARPSRHTNFIIHGTGPL